MTAHGDRPDAGAGAADAGREALDRWQRDVAAALFDDIADAAHTALASGIAALRAQPGFAVYRNTVRSGCIAALGDNHPTVRTLLGADAFAALADAHVRAEPPGDGRLAVYGSGFAAFVARHPLSTRFPWLVDVARLDRAWMEAHLAADAPALRPDAVAALAADALLALPLEPHPAARLVRLADPYAWAVWRHHRDAEGVGREPGPLDLTEADACSVALLTRPHDAVRWHAPGSAAAEAFAHVANGATFEALLEAIGGPAVGAFQVLLQHGALRLRPADA